MSWGQLALILGEILGKKERTVWKLCGKREAYGGGLVGEGLRLALRARLSEVIRALLRMGLCGILFLVGLVVITKDHFDRGRPRSNDVVEKAQ